MRAGKEAPTDATTDTLSSASWGDRMPPEISGCFRDTGECATFVDEAGIAVIRSWWCLHQNSVFVRVYEVIVVI